MSSLGIGEIVTCPTVLEFSLVCRICLRREDTGAMCLQPIHAYIDTHNTNNQIDLTDKINKCSDINVQRNYHLLPNNICMKCYNLLLIAHYFRTLSVKSDKALRNILANTPEINFKKEIENVQVKVEIEVEGDLDDWRDKYDTDHSVKNESSPNRILIVNQDYLNSQNDVMKDVYICDVCKKIFHDKNLFTDHIQSHNETLHDNVTNNSNTKTSRRKRNRSTVNTESSGLYECLVCDTSFSNQKCLTKHMFIHKKSTKYKCYGCDVVFVLYSERTQHERFCCPNMPPGTKYECTSCKEKFEHRCLFDAHVNYRCVFNKAKSQKQSDTVKIDPILKCSQCDYFTTKKLNLKNHIIVNHTSEKPFVCEICGKGYCTVYKLVEHNKHSHLPRNETFKCKLCPFETKTKSTIPKHMRQHTGETRYSCELCGKHFVNSSNYHVHVRRQHGEKNLQCDMCTKKFSLNRDLQEHKSFVHLGHKFNICQTCGAGFSRRKGLAEHSLRVHKIKMPKARPGRKAREELIQEMVK